MPLYVKSSISEKYFPANIYSKYGYSTLFPKEEFLSFEEAREFVRKLKLKGYKEWRQYIKSGKKPSYIPANPSRYYKNKGWTNFIDFLGIEDFLTFEEKNKDDIEKIKNLHNLLCTPIEIAIQIGEILSQQKSKIPHGNFTEFVKKNFGFSNRTCTNYILLYLNKEKIKKSGINNMVEAYKFLSKK